MATTIRAAAIEDFFWWFESPLETRIATALSGYGYAVVSVNVERGFFSRDVTIDITVDANDTTQLRQDIASAVLDVTGNVATQIGKPSEVTGVFSPETVGRGAAAVAGEGLSLVQQLANLLGTTEAVAQGLLIVAGIGAAFLILTIAQNPERGARLARSLR